MTGQIFNIQKFSLHDGPGIRTTVFFKGCNFRCGWCANPESQRMEVQLTLDAEKCTGCGACIAACPAGARSLVNGISAVDASACTTCGACIGVCPVQAIAREGSAKSVEEIVCEVLKDKPFYDGSGGGVTFSGGEPLLQMEFAGALADELHRQGVSVAIETAGAIEPDRFRAFLPKLDFIHIDFKHHDSAAHMRGTGIGNEQVVENIKAVRESGIPFVVRIPVIPGFNDSLEDARGFASVLRSAGVEKVQLLPFHQLGERKYSLLGREYAFTGVSQLHREDLEDYRREFIKNNVNAEF